MSALILSKLAEDVTTGDAIVSFDSAVATWYAGRGIRECGEPCGGDRL